MLLYRVTEGKDMQTEKNESSGKRVQEISGGGL